MRTLVTLFTEAAAGVVINADLSRLTQLSALYFEDMFSLDAALLSSVLTQISAAPALRLLSLNRIWEWTGLFPESRSSGPTRAQIR